MDNIILIAENKIVIRKDFSETGFAKKELPEFNGDFLTIYFEKKNQKQKLLQIACENWQSLTI